jgi:hypothetical protein
MGWLLRLSCLLGLLLVLILLHHWLMPLLPLLPLKLKLCRFAGLSLLLLQVGHCSYSIMNESAQVVIM